MDTLGIKIQGNFISAKMIKIIRTEISTSISDIKNKIISNEYLYECDATDEEGLLLIIKLYNNLTSNGIFCELYEHNRISSITFFNNLSNMYSEINNEINEITDNEIDANL